VKEDLLLAKIKEKIGILNLLKDLNSSRFLNFKMQPRQPFYQFGKKIQMLLPIQDEFMIYKD